MTKPILTFLLVLFIFSGTLLGQIIKVDDFGAVGDGVTNDKNAIQSALNKLKTDGGTLQFTSGKVYRISKGLNLDDYSGSKNYKLTTTEEEKATIKIADGAPLIWEYWVIKVDNSKNVEINNLIFDGNRATRVPTEETPGDVLFVLDNCNGLRLTNVNFKNAPEDNIYIGVRNHSNPASFLTDFEMYNCILENAWRDNMSVIRGKNFKIIGCEFNGANGYAPEGGIDFEPNSGGDSMGYQNMLIEGCTFRNNNQYGLYLNDINTESGYSTVKNNVFDNNALFIASEYNIAKNNIFINLDHIPTFSPDNDPRDGIIYFRVDNASNYNKVYNNYFYNNPTPPEMHLINFMGNAGSNNEAYDNFAYNNNVAGFVNREEGQIVYGNRYLNNLEMGYWNFDLGFVSETSANDLSDFGQTGTLHGNPTIVGGKFNEALDFSPDNKYIEIPVNREHLNIEMNITISAWVNWKGNNSEREQEIVGRNKDWRVGIDKSGKVGFFAHRAGSLPYTAGWTKSEASIPTDEWTLVTVTYDGKMTKIYINGAEDMSEEGYGRLDTSSAKIYIGSLVGEEKSFNGSIDDVRIYNYALSTSEINDLFTAPNVNSKVKPDSLGTVSSPYQIASIQNLSWLAQSEDEWNAHYVQISDIDLSVTATWDDSDDDGDGDKYNDPNDRLAFGNNEGWSPIGNLNGTKKFTGSYDGGGYTIKGVSITNRSTDGNGFFGEIKNGVVKNLSLTKIDIHGSNIVGGLVASCEGDSIINLSTTGKITCVDGGIVGANFGGLVGVAKDNLVIKQSYSDVTIKGSGANSTKVGGLVGSVNTAKISACYTLGNIKTVEASAGGFAGEVSGSSVIAESYSVGLVGNGASDKGFVGAVSGTPTFTNNFFNSETSNHTSSVGATAKTTDEMIKEETFTGWDFATTWETKTNYPNLLENSNQRLEKGINFQPIEAPEGSGTEFEPYKIESLQNLLWLAQIDSVWGDYFIQTSDIDAGETATWDDSDDNNDGNKYNDPNDLTTEGTNDGFAPIGNSSTKFEGNYDGKEYVIDKLNIKRPSSKYVGFFGLIEKSDNIQSEIKNMSLTHINVVGKGKVGGLVGENYGVKITNCFSEGQVGSSSSDGYIGGLIGSNNHIDAIISKCYSNVQLTSSGSGQYIGGFVGRNRSGAEINKSYSKGSVESGGNKVGGFIGQNAASKVINCFSMASVSSTGSGTNIGGFCGAVYGASIEYSYSIGANSADNTKGFLGAKGGIGNVFTSNYLDTEASGCNQTAVQEAASGKTTSEMQTESTYAGWDFTNIWNIEGNYYPLLTGVKVSVKENESGVIPTEFVLEQNYPNPFNPTTVIRFSIPKQGNVKLSIFNVLGEKVAELINENLSAGNHEVNFDASTSSATASNLSSGMYLYRISVTSTNSVTDNFIAVKKMMLLK